MDEVIVKIYYVTGSKKVTKKEIKELVGSLAFVVKVLSASRAFDRRVYEALQGIDTCIYFSFSFVISSNIGCKTELQNFQCRMIYAVQQLFQ